MVALNFQKQYKCKSVIVKFVIPASCYNAGNILKFGGSVYPSEFETLIPPYTVAKLSKKSELYAEILICKDNKNVSF